MQTENQNMLSILNRELEGIQAIHHLRDILVIVQKLRGGSMLYSILKSNSFNKEAGNYRKNLEDNTKIIFLKHRLSKDVEYFLKLAEEEILTQDLIFIEQGDDLFNSETLFYNELFDLFTNHIKKRIAFYSKITFREKAISFSAVASLTFFIIYQASQLLLITN